MISISRSSRNRCAGAPIGSVISGASTSACRARLASRDSRGQMARALQLRSRPIRRRRFQASRPWLVTSRARLFEGRGAYTRELVFCSCGESEFESSLPPAQRSTTVISAELFSAPPGSRRFARANFAGARMGEATLSRADLTNTCFDGADLTHSPQRCDSR